MIPTPEQILSAAHADDNDESQPMTLRRLREAIDVIAADLVDDDVPVLVVIRTGDGPPCIGMLNALTPTPKGGVIVEATSIGPEN